ncbi:ABC transporter substrate-binding protein [Candidatus Parcubacteria bacterium]|nr:ABC transporter substrate-binding protein [Candidatus Parcubacteria bacterium]
MSLIERKTRFLGVKFYSWFKKTKNTLVQPEEKDINQQLILKLNKKKMPSFSQIRQLPKFLNKIEKFQLIVALVILLVASFTIGWRFWLTQSTPIPKAGGTYTEGMIGAPSYVNPILATSDVDRDLVKLIFSGLMKFDEQGQLVEDLALGYRIDAEQTTYTFELKDGLRWHDGTPLIADDIIFTINSIKNPEYSSPLKNSFSGVSVHKINDKTIQFKLEKPFAPFLSILTVGIIPEHLWYSTPALSVALSPINTRPIGSGPYQFKALTRDGSGIVRNYTLESYPDYHLVPAYISELHFKFYPDFDTGVAALQNKNVDGLVYLPKEYKEELVKNKKITLHNLQFPQYTAIFFNPKNNELLADADIRKALALSVDKQRILTEVLNGDGQISNAPILPGMIGHDENIKAPDLNIEEANNILEELGWKYEGENDFRTKGEEDEKTELSIKLTTVAQSENSKTVEIIKEGWKSIGVKTEIDTITKDKIKKDVIEPRNYQALLFGEVININSGLYPFWHSTQNAHPGLNLSVMANKDVDQYLEDALAAKTNEEKIEPLKKFQEKLLELNFAIFLYNPTYTYPTASKLYGLDSLQFINLPADRFNNINSWYLKTKRIISR